MPALIEAGVSKQQLLTVWATNGDTGFTPAQLLAAGITSAELYAGGIPGYLLFNGVCNTPLSVGTAPAPTIKLLSTNLSPTDTNIVLEGQAANSIRWSSSILPGQDASLTVLSDDPIEMLGNMIAERIRIENTTIVSTLTIPFAYVFSNSTITVGDRNLRSTSIQLCPGR